MRCGADADPTNGLILHTNRALLERGRGRYEEALAAFRASGSTRSHCSQPTPWRRTCAPTASSRGSRSARPSACRKRSRACDDETLDSLQMRVVLAALHLAQDQPQDAPRRSRRSSTISRRGSTSDGRSRRFCSARSRSTPLRDAGGASRVLERALNLAESNGVILPFLFFPAADLLERHVRVRTAHASLISDIRDLLSGTNTASTTRRSGAAAGATLRERASRAALPARPTCLRPRSPPSCSCPSTRSGPRRATCTTSWASTRGHRPCSGPAS